jgi:hypothetical protein
VGGRERREGSGNKCEMEFPLMMGRERIPRLGNFYKKCTILIHYYYACYDENRLKMCQMFFPLLLHPSDWPVSHAKKGVGDKGGGAEGKTRRMTMTTSLFL